MVQKGRLQWDYANQRSDPTNYRILQLPYLESLRLSRSCRNLLGRLNELAREIELLQIFIVINSQTPSDDYPTKETSLYMGSLKLKWYCEFAPHLNSE